MSGPTIQTPNCPFCDELPVLVLDEGHQCFCGNDRCPCFTWDAWWTKAQNRLEAKAIKIVDRKKGSDE